MNCHPQWQIFSSLALLWLFQEEIEKDFLLCTKAMDLKDYLKRGTTKTTFLFQIMLIGRLKDWPLFKPNRQTYLIYRTSLRKFPFNCSFPSLYEFQCWRTTWELRPWCHIFKTNFSKPKFHSSIQLWMCKWFQQDPLFP